MSNNNDMIFFTPEPGFIIENLAEVIVEMMKILNMDARIRLSKQSTLDIDRRAKAKDIVKAYKELQKRQIRARVPSNKNQRKAPTPSI